MISNPLSSLHHVLWPRGLVSRRHAAPFVCKQTLRGILASALCSVHAYQSRYVLRVDLWEWRALWQRPLVPAYWHVREDLSTGLLTRSPSSCRAHYWRIR